MTLLVKEVLCAQNTAGTLLVKKNLLHRRPYRLQFYRRIFENWIEDQRKN
jgi:hypothetical protein